MKKLLVLLAIVFVFSGCTDASNAQRVLSAQGYTDIKTTGYCWFGCSEDDFKHTGFIAKSLNGQTVEGVVCQGLIFKGATVRIK